MKSHQKIVENLVASIKKFHARHEPFRIRHGSTNSTRHGLQNRANTIDISDLRRVLSVDTRSKTALVEPNVPMDRLVECTLQHGLIPPVVMEFPGITAGGGYAGTGGESSSFKYGYFNETVNRAEIVLGNGDVVNASRQENAALFHGASGAVGSLGVTTLLELQLIDAKKYVKTTYHSVSSISESVQKIQEETQKHDHDYIDGILFSPDHGAIVTGSLTDECPPAGHVQTFSSSWDPWYYLHVQAATCSPANTPTTEYIPLPEYLFRYDRGGFWVGRSAFSYFKFPFNRFSRWFLDDFTHTRMLYRALQASGQSAHYVVQDLALPFPKAVEFIDYTKTSFDIWPLWLCPLRQPSLPSLHPHSPQSANAPVAPSESLLLNIGLWGFGPKGQAAFIAKNRELEEKLRQLGGMKWLYAHAYYSEEEFWSMFDRRWYDDLRQKYHAENLPSVWQKVAVDPEVQERAVQSSWSKWLLQFWPFGGFWGIWRAIRSGDYLLARSASWKHKSSSRGVGNKPD
ncbi:MAG: hypothetical protein M1831_000594 [Alyxoria varia]|nr:MAG: hypothetical protein M1831_000594 [Alyxoria varia]